MAKGKKSSYLKKAAKFATGQGKQKQFDKDGSRHKNTQQVSLHASMGAVLAPAAVGC